MYIGDAKVDFDLNVIESALGPTQIEPKIMRLLKYLSNNPNIVHSREDLITAVWGVDFGGDERLSRAISILRKALGEEKGKRKYIETISRKGYRLIADISTDSPEVAPPSAIISTPTQKSPLNWLIAGLCGAVVSAALIFLFLPQTSPSLTNNPISISEALAEGYEGIRYYGHDGAIEKSQSLFTQVLEQDPDNAAAHAGLALAYIREYTALESDPSLLNQARASALLALENNEHLALSHIAMAWASEAQSEQEKALQFLERADLLDKDNPFILESRIRVFMSANNYEAANVWTQKALAIHPDIQIFHTYRAIIYLMNNDLKNAEIYARQAMTLNPENPWVYSSLGHILHLQNKPTEAIKTIQSGLEVRETASLYNNLGTYLFFQGYYDLAASAFEKTLKLSGNSHDPLSWANLGDAYRWIPGKKELSVQKYNRAIQLWEEGLLKYPDNKALKTRIALYKAKLKSGKKPNTLINEIIESENLEAILYYRMLVTAEIWGERQKALNLLEKSINTGYPLNEIRNDPELKALREDQAYHLIVSQ